MAGTQRTIDSLRLLPGNRRAPRIASDLHLLRRCGHGGGAGQYRFLPVLQRQRTLNGKASPLHLLQRQRDHSC